jgi:hypothetical protein
VAITEAQIDAYGLPTRPTKATDLRARRFQGRSVEQRVSLSTVMHVWAAPPRRRRTPKPPL